MNVVKLNELNLLKKEVEEFGQQRKYLGSENMRQEHLVDILKDQCVVLMHDYEVSE